jgi:hypothetical protein
MTHSKPHLFTFKPATLFHIDERRWAAIRFDQETGLYHWSVGRTASEAYDCNVLQSMRSLRSATLNNPYENLKTKGWH